MQEQERVGYGRRDVRGEMTSDESDEEREGRGDICNLPSALGHSMGSILSRWMKERGLTYPPLRKIEDCTAHGLYPITQLQVIVEITRTRILGTPVFVDVNESN